MRWDDYVEVDVSRLSLPGDVAKRMREPRVVELAESVGALGGQPMHAPSVNADVTPWELVAGRDRMAALLLRKAKKVWVHVGRDWSALDLLKAEIHENLHRRHDDKPALTKQLVDQAEQLVKADKERERIQGQPSQNSRGVGQPKTDRAKAREIVAEASGETPEAVRKRDERAQARTREEAGEPTVGAVSAPASSLIEAYGNPIPERVEADQAAIAAAFEKADKLLRQAQTAIGDLGLTDFSPGIVARLKAAVHDAAALVRGERPTHLCPYCKGKSDPKNGPRCAPCQERGTVTKAAFEAAPEEKRRGAKPTKPTVEGDEPEPGDCAHAYRKGGVPTGICLNCGAPGAATWTEAEKVPKGTKAPPHDPTDPGWVPHGPGSDRNQPKKATPGTSLSNNQAAFGSPEWHRNTASVHGSGAGYGTCGCKSCNVVRRELGKPEIDHSAKPPKKKGLRVVLADGVERSIEEAQAFLDGEG